MFFPEFNLSVPKMIERLRLLFARFKSVTKKEWKDLEYFDEGWKQRIEQMAVYVPAHSVVMDLGCGRQWLRDYLDCCQYIPVDYCSRSSDTLVCDFNKREFPEKLVDVCFVSGCLEYVENPQWFIDKITAHCRQCVISYCTVKRFPNFKIRRSMGWKNNLAADELISLFAARGMVLTSEAITATNNSIFCFVAQRRETFEHNG